MSYDPAKTDEAALIAAVKQSGFTASVVREDRQTTRAKTQAIPSPKSAEPDPAFFLEALALAKREHKPLVLDFYASWCLPCKRQEQELFPEPEVASLLKHFIFVKIDTDQHTALAKKYGVVSLPDIRLLSSEGVEKKKLAGIQTPRSFAVALKDMIAE